MVNFSWNRHLNTGPFENHTKSEKNSPDFERFKMPFEIWTALFDFQMPLPFEN
jgi:hypothetical protein